MENEDQLTVLAQKVLDEAKRQGAEQAQVRNI